MERDYRANRAFGALNKDDTISFKQDDPILVSLLGTGYLDPVEMPVLEEPAVKGISSKEKFGKATIIQE